MRLYDAKGNAYTASKVKRPRLHSRLKCWDTERRYLDGEPIEMWLERNWGTAFYFEIARQWYRLPFYKRSDLNSPDTFEIDKFFTVRPAWRGGRGDER